MKPLVTTAMFVTALTLGTTMAFAQSGAQLGDGHNLTVPPNSWSGGAAAHVGDGSDPNYLKTQQELTTEPGYSIGTGDAAKNAASQKGSK